MVPPIGGDPRQPLKALSLGAFRILAAVADTVCPGNDELPSAWALQVPEAVDHQLDRMHPGNALELAQALWLVENPVAGTLLDQRPRRFTAATPAERARVLDRWRTSQLPPRRTAYRALSGLIAASYWAHPDTYAFVGYPGPPRFPT